MKRLVLALALLACDPPTRTPEQQKIDATWQKIKHRDTAAYRALESSGYTEIIMDGTPIFACGQDYSWFTSYDFTAINVAGNKVEGVVCCGLVMKGCTVKF